MKKGKGIQNTLIIVLSLVIIAMSVGYAFQNVELTLSNEAQFKELKWHIAWDEESYTESSGSVAGTTEFNTEDTSLTTSVTLDKVGDFYEYTVDALNDGDFDANCTSITITASDKKFVSYSVNYGGQTYTTSGTNSVEVPLAAGDSETVTVRIEYILPDSEEDLPQGQNDTEYETVTLSAAFNYAQDLN